MAGPRRGGGPKRWGKSQKAMQPDGTVRQSQTVTTFGPGAMMDLLKQAVLVGGLDFWQFGDALQVIHEPRLRDTIGPRFDAIHRSLSVEGAFREPPAGDDRNPTRFAGIQVLEFPAWFVCQNPKCRALIGHRGLDLKGGRYFHRCDGASPTECVPVRFLGACRRGHCEDWPWSSFVHEMQGKPRCTGFSLALAEGASGDFSQVIASCTTCGASAPLSAAQSVQFSCSGDRPWLGTEGREECSEKLRLLVRTASNSYFPQVISALSVPDPGAELDEKVASVWDVLMGATAQTLPVLRTAVPKVQAALAGFDDADVLAAVERRKKGGKGGAREPIRTPEFRQFISSKAEIPGELPQSEDSFFARRVTPDEGLPSGVARLVLAAKLREVRVQIGFTRIEPVTPDLQGEFDLGVESALLGLQTNWLPATEVRGEGIFIQLDEAAVTAWESRENVIARGKELLAGYDAWAATARGTVQFPGVRFFMLHSLAHLLMQAISLDCGYAASAIRERIYCSRPGDPVPMAAILISTGTTGTEGTLGGLVDQGRRLRHHLRRAFDRGILCSNDPVCASHTPKGDHAERWLEGAACHGCLFVAECSCEWFNRYLDRALVVPTMTRAADVAFFSEKP